MASNDKQLVRACVLLGELKESTGMRFGTWEVHHDHLWKLAEGDFCACPPCKDIWKEATNG